ncbi:MAG: hypothetical protein ACE14V_12080 [bacterium]
MFKRIIIFSIIIIAIGLPLIYYPQLERFFHFYVPFPKIDATTRADITYLVKAGAKLNQTSDILFKRRIADVWRTRLRGEQTSAVYAEVLEKAAYTYRDTANRLNHEAYLIASKTGAKPREIKIVFELAGWPESYLLPDRYYYYQGCLANLESISTITGKESITKINGIRMKYRLPKWSKPINWGIGLYSFQNRLYQGGQEYLIVDSINRGADINSLSRGMEPEYKEKQYEAERKKALLAKKKAKTKKKGRKK